MRYDVRESHYLECSRKESNLHFYSYNNESQANEECSTNISDGFHISDIDYFQNSEENYFSFNESETVTEFENISLIAGYGTEFYSPFVLNDVHWTHGYCHPPWYRGVFTSHVNSYNQKHISLFRTLGNACDQENYKCKECGCSLIHWPGYMHGNSDDCVQQANQSHGFCHREYPPTGPQMTVEKINNSLSNTPNDRQSLFPNEENFIWYQVPRPCPNNYSTNQEYDYYNCDYNNSLFQDDEFEDFVTWFKDVNPTQDHKQFHVWVCSTPTQWGNQEYEEFQVLMEESG